MFPSFDFNAVVKPQLLATCAVPNNTKDTFHQCLTIVYMLDTKISETATKCKGVGSSLLNCVRKLL